MLIGIDTLKIGTQDYEIEKHSRLIKNTKLNMETGSIYEKYFYNDEKKDFHLQIRKGLTFQFSVPLFYGLDSNFYMLGSNSFETVINSVERELENIGVVADLDSAKVLRIDVFSNARTSETFSTYRPVLQSLSLKRTHNRQYGVDTFLSHNSQREVEFYNKVKELTQKKGLAYVRQLGFNSEDIVRGELRLLKHREIKKKLSISTFKEIPDNWSILKETYSNFMRNDIFKNNFKDEEGVEKMIPLEALKKYGTEAFKMYSYVPFFSFSDDEIRTVLLEAVSRKQAYNILKQIRKAKKRYEILSRELSYKKLYSELRAKFTN